MFDGNADAKGAESSIVYFSRCIYQFNLKTEAVSDAASSLCAIFGKYFRACLCVKK